MDGPEGLRSADVQGPAETDVPPTSTGPPRSCGTVVTVPVVPYSDPGRRAGTGHPISRETEGASWIVCSSQNLRPEPLP